MRLLIRLCCALIAALSLGLTLFFTPHASASNFNVNSLADTPDALLTDGLCADASGVCTLRAAIQQANSDAFDDTIGFGVNGTINLTGALPDLSTNITINGPGAGQLNVRRDTGGDYSIFRISAGVTASISGLTIGNGRAPAGANVALDGGGGGIFNAGTLTLNGCVVSGNSTADASDTLLLSAAHGGGIRNTGTLTMTACNVSSNNTGRGGATDLTRFGGSGGGIYNTGALTMTNCAVSNNSTGSGGNALAQNGGDGGQGGGIANASVGLAAFPGSMTLTNCNVSGNRTGNGGVTQGGTGFNTFAGFGGHGGGIYNSSTMTITGSTISDNSTGVGANARLGVTSTAGSGGSGGGIYNTDALTMTNCVVRNNATGNGGIGSGQNLSKGNGGDGGGIANPSSSGVLKLSHSDIISNQTGLAGDGGGLDGRGGGISGGARIRSTIVALNHIRFPTSATDVSGSNFVSFGYNFISVSSGGCCFVDTDRRGSSSSADVILNIDPSTLIPFPGSPVIDNGLARDIDDQPVTTDIRGLPRPFDNPTVPPQTGGDNSDIGAFERQSADPTPTPLPTTVQFSVAAGQVAEGCVQTQFTITRTGATSGTTEATYVINNLSASQRGDFTYTTGRVTFAPGEGSKVVPVLISEDAYAEGVEFLTVSLTSVTGGTIGFQNSVSLQINDNETSDGATNPIDDDATFVCQHYHDFLSRQSDVGGQDFWTNQLASCAGDPGCLERKRVDVSAAFFLSIEFQQTGYFVIRVNKAAFGDQPGNPRYLSFLGETQGIGRGVVVGQPGFEALLEAHKQQYAEEFVLRADFQTAHGGQDAAHYVDSLFVNTGASPTQEERDAALSAFGTGDTAGRARALRSVVESGSVYNRLYNPAFVLMQYFAYLRRNPDNSPDNSFDGYNFWLAKLNQFTRPGEDARDERVALNRVRRAEMVRAFLISDEYRGRFQGDPNRGSQFDSIASLGGIRARWLRALYRE